MSHEHDTLVRAGRWLAAILVVAACYYLGAALGLRLALVRGQVTPLWPPTGIALGALLVLGRRVWPGITLGAVLANITLGPSGVAVIAIAAGNTLAPVAASLLLSWAGFHRDLGRVRDVLTLVLLGAFGAMVLSAAIGTTALLLTGGIPAGAFWSTSSVWWAGDAMGVLAVTPAILAVRSVGPVSLRSVALGRWAEAVALIAGLVLITVGITVGRLPVLFLFFPLLLWAAWRFRPVVAATSSLVASVGVTLAAVAGREPFAGLSTAERMITLQAFNGSAVLITLLVATAVGARRRALRAVEQAARELDERVAARTAELARAVGRLERSQEMLIEAQRVGQVGSWERDLVTGEVSWSDELFRLYGLTPRSICLDYPTFLDHVHPDDRDEVAASNERALREHSDVEGDHRVVWPDGGVHWIHRRGTVLLDDVGTPVRMVGTAQDITAATVARDALRRSEEQFRTLLASIPDAVVGVDAAGHIVLVNERTEELFGYRGGELVGQPVEVLVPDRYRDRHLGHRTAFLADPRTRPMGADLELFARRRDGTEFPADIALSPLREGSAGLVLAAVRDVTERRQAEAARRDLREAQLRRLQALEINDTVVQGLSASVYALERGERSAAAHTLRRTLRAARQMMGDLLGADTEINAGDLVRQRPAAMAGGQRSTTVLEAAEPGRISVVVADDSPDMRFAMRAFLESVHGITLVGEAADGAEAVRVVTGQRPDLVLLDLAMPVLDGLGALTQIHAMCPRTKVVVFSGYGREQAAAQALAQGAVGYLEKGDSTDELVALLARLFPDAIRARPRASG